MPIDLNNENVVLVDSAEVALAVTSGSAIPAGTRSLLAAGSDGTNARTVSTDTSGRQVAVGAAANAAAVAGNPVLVGGSDGTNARSLPLKAPSTAPVATDPSVVVTISPNSAGITATNASVGANGSAIPTSSTQIGASDGTNLRAFAGDSNGLIYTQTLQQAIARARVTGLVSSLNGEVSTNAATKALIASTAVTATFTGVQRSISSASASDAAAGTGARTVRITYYTISGLTVSGPSTETVTLNGTTAVNTVATNIAFVEKMEVLTVGSGGSNAGIITLFAATAGGGGGIGSIALGTNATLWAQHFVASGKVCMLHDLYVENDSASGNNPKISIEVMDPTSTNNAERPSLIVRLDGRTNISYGRTVPIAVTGPARVRAYVTPVNAPVQTTTFDMSFVEI